MHMEAHAVYGAVYKDWVCEPLPATRVGRVGHSGAAGSPTWKWGLNLALVGRGVGAA